MNSIIKDILEQIIQQMDRPFSFAAVSGIIGGGLFMWNLSRFLSSLKTSWEVLTISAYYVCHAVVRNLQRLLWAYNGVADQLVMAEYGAVYDTCVHVQKIINRGRFSIMNHPRPWDFVGVHEGFAHPQTLLNPSITLYCVTPTHAYFLQCPEDIDVHQSSISPFMYMAQYYHAEKIYSIPLGHFHRLADEVGDPRVPVIWITSTGRCGSTLVGQMLEKLPGTRCLSESDSLTNISLMQRAGQQGPSELSKTIRSTVRMLCKEAPGVQRIVFKCRFNCVTELEPIMEHFPQFRHIYVYRNLGAVMKSYFKFLHRDTAMCLLEWLVNSRLISHAMPFIRNYLVHFIAGKDSLEKVEQILPKVNFMGYVTAIICSCIVEFQNMTRKGFIVQTLHYDELMRNPVEVTSKLFQLLSLPQDYVHMSLAAMQHDTQHGTILSNIYHRNSTNARQMTGKDTKDINVVLQAMGLPDMKHEMSLPNSLMG
ncbi:hypothetical protein EGW08_012047 [Elysia chlorotica]|uniref:Sulfotransferase domain-containing protein n=1 Tax=Elysia chlorotica TaxID=188477 RepID=A0A3S1C179_ELYCH|nr:hypothetical protein EGW08_012047 [Elysia chlorotica]